MEEIDQMMKVCYEIEVANKWQFLTLSDLKKWNEKLLGYHKGVSQFQEEVGIPMPKVFVTLDGMIELRKPDLWAMVKPEPKAVMRVEIAPAKAALEKFVPAESPKSGNSRKVPASVIPPLEVQKRPSELTKPEGSPKSIGNVKDERKIEKKSKEGHRKSRESKFAVNVGERSPGKRAVVQKRQTVTPRPTIARIAAEKERQTKGDIERGADFFKKRTSFTPPPRLSAVGAKKSLMGAILPVLRDKNILKSISESELSYKPDTKLTVHKIDTLKVMPVRKLKANIEMATQTRIGDTEKPKDAFKSLNKTVTMKPRTEMDVEHVLVDSELHEDFNQRAPDYYGENLDDSLRQELASGIKVVGKKLFGDGSAWSNSSSREFKDPLNRELANSIRWKLKSVEKITELQKLMINYIVDFAIGPQHQLKEAKLGEIFMSILNAVDKITNPTPAEPNPKNPDALPGQSSIDNEKILNSKGKDASKTRDISVTYKDYEKMSRNYEVELDRARNPKHKISLPHNISDKNVSNGKKLSQRFANSQNTSMVNFRTRERPSCKDIGGLTVGFSGHNKRVAKSLNTSQVS